MVNEVVFELDDLPGALEHAEIEHLGAAFGSMALATRTKVPTAYKPMEFAKTFNSVYNVPFGGDDWPTFDMDIMASAHAQNIHNIIKGKIDRTDDNADERDRLSDHVFYILMTRREPMAPSLAAQPG